jgi:hypothetical protein
MFCIVSCVNMPPVFFLNLLFSNAISIQIIALMMRWLLDMEQLVEWELAGEMKVLRENLPQCLFVHYKSHMTWPWIRCGKLGTNHLSYDARAWVWCGFITLFIQTKQTFHKKLCLFASVYWPLLQWIIICEQFTKFC